MPVYQNNKRIKRCGDCSFCVKVEVSPNVFDTFCEPVKEKHGYNSINEDSKPNKAHCRLTNEVDMSYIFDYGQFWGMTVGEVREKAPQYIKCLEKKRVLKLSLSK